jgi:kynurenine formamidase
MSARPSLAERMTPAAILGALSLARQGKVFSLESGWWRAMPVPDVHAQFELVTYRSPRGFRVQGDMEFLNPPQNTVGFGFLSELMIGSAHTGTHMDALCHIVCGTGEEWYGGRPAADGLGDFGAMSEDASTLPPVIARGVLLDVPRALGLEHLASGYPITRVDLERTARSQGVELRDGDAVFVRTGLMQFWPDTERMAVAAGSGISIDAARWLCEFGPMIVGGDNAALECVPSYVDGDPQPVHVELIQKNGIPIMEWVNLEEIAAAEVYEFAFVCLPLTITGATGSMVRPIAII